MTRSPIGTPDVLVLGAGLQGSCVALALASLGHQVTVLDRASRPMTGASRNTEAKIHLGYVYAADPTGTTQRRMLAGALAFAPLLDRWLGPQDWARYRSPTFHYLAMPDSMLAPDELEADYARTDDALPDVSSQVETTIGTAPDYLGRPLRGRASRVSPASVAELFARPVDAAFQTPEVGIDPDRLADAVSAALEDHDGITVRAGTEVQGAARDGHGFRIDAVTSGEPAELRAAAVVNCLWDDRLRVDASLGLSSPVPEWTLRVKHMVVVRPRSATPVPTTTMVQGPYGDTIAWRPDRICVSWYPVGCTALHRVTAEELPDLRVRVTRPPIDVAGKTLAVMTALFPSLEGAEVLDVRGGVIVAPGASDIDDPDSRLHLRDNPSVHEHDGWWSIDTGKLTLAPLLAHEAATRVDRALRGA